MEKGKESTFLLFTWSFVFVFLPLQLPVFEWKNVLLLPFWEKVLEGVFHKEMAIYSDSAGFLFIITCLLILSAMIFGLLQLTKKLNLEKIHFPLRLFLIACLFIIFTKYGLDKVMHLQFPSPEPNLMLTELGVLDKDILYWTSIGSSRLYNLITGGIEIFSAILLLFHRTRRLGLILLLLSTAYIVLINFSFNIGVKMFSFLLLGTLLSLNWNSLRFLYNFFAGFGDEKKKTVQKRVYLPVLKIILATSLLLFFYEINKDNQIENPMMGAYKSCTSKELAYVFINQQDYWIEEKQNGDRKSFKIIQTGKKIMQIEDARGNRKEISFFENEKQQYELVRSNTEKEVFQKLDLSALNLNQDRVNLIVR